MLEKGKTLRIENATEQHAIDRSNSAWDRKAAGTETAENYTRIVKEKVDVENAAQLIPHEAEHMTLI